MSKESEKIAGKTMRSHIKFIESLITHIRGNDEVMKARAMWASWCIHRYMNEGLIKDIEDEMTKKREKERE